MTEQTTPDDDALVDLEHALMTRLPQLLTEVGNLLRENWPDYSEFLDESGADVADAAGLFVHRLLAMTRRSLSNLTLDPLQYEPTAKVVFEQIGRAQWNLGHGLTELLTAYQVGARAAWRHVSDTALELRLDPDVLAALADAVFVFVNQLSSASAHGYVLEQSESSAERERLRQELSELLLSDRSDSVAVRAAAARVGWALPSTAAVILVDPADHRARGIVERLGSQCLPVRQSALYGAIVPDPVNNPGRASTSQALRGANAVVGHPVPLGRLPASTQVAQLAMELQRRGLLRGDPIFASEHLDMIVTQRDERMINALRTQVLQPLAQLPEATRLRLTDTLASWLRQMGDRQLIARELHIHPQTVRYRLGQLRDCFGDALDSPRERARMMLALEWSSPAG